MTSRYRITVHSPMGPREGCLLLRVSEGVVTGTLTLLGFEQPLSGEVVGGGRLRLRHRVRTAVSDVECESILDVGQDTLSGVMYTGSGSMRWSGRLEESQKQAANPERGVGFLEQGDEGHVHI